MIWSDIESPFCVFLFLCSVHRWLEQMGPVSCLSFYTWSGTHSICDSIWVQGESLQRPSSSSETVSNMFFTCVPEGNYVLTKSKFVFPPVLSWPLWPPFFCGHFELLLLNFIIYIIYLLNLGLLLLLLLKLFSPVSFYFFNMANRTFKMIYMVHILFLLNRTD